MNKQQELIESLLKKAGNGEITWKTIDSDSQDEKNIDQFNQNKYYQEFKFDGFVSKIHDQNVYVLRETSMFSKLIDYKYVTYISNTEDRIVAKITESQLADKRLLKDLFTVVSRMVDDADSNIDSLLSKINNIGKF